MSTRHAAPQGQHPQRPQDQRPKQQRQQQLEIDWTRCDGHGLCAALLPGSVRLDDWGYPVIDPSSVARESGSDLRRAVGVCPALALRLV